MLSILEQSVHAAYHCSSEKLSSKKIRERFRDQTKEEIPPKEEESDSQDVVEKETKKDDLNKEVRDALTRKAGAPSQISLHSS